MEPLWVGVAGICILAVLLLLGVYVAIALGLAGVLGMIVIIGFEPAMSLLGTTLLRTATNYTLIVIPLFITMGLFSAEAGLSTGIYNTLSKWLGRIRGGLGLATVGACTIFGMLTGSSIVTALVFAKVSVPEMRRHGYDAKLSYGLVSSAGAIGMLIPPSLLAIIYALITEQSVGELLLGGIGPGLVLAFCLGSGFVALLYLRPSLGPDTRGASVTWRERFVSLPSLWPAFVVGVIVIGGIYSGIFTVTEAAGIGAFILFILFLFTKRGSRQSWQMLAACLRESISLSAMVLLILAGALIFGRFLVLSEIAPKFTEFILAMNLSGIQFAIATAVVFLVMGCIMDSTSIVAITIPLLYPIANSMDLDPVWFAMVAIMASQVGLITPPLGLSVYAVKGVADPDISLGDIFHGVIPFLFLMVVALALIIAFPFISTWIPYHMRG